MKSMTIRIIYGPGEPLETAREVVERTEELGAVTFSHDNVFQQRDNARETVKALVKVVELLQGQQAMPDDRLDVLIEQILTSIPEVLG